MDDEQDLASSRRSERLAEKMRDQRYRDRYVESHSRQFLARQMREFRGDKSQAEFASEIDKKQTVVSRLEDPSYTGWSLRTMFDIARKRNVAVVARFVDFPTFFRITSDLSDHAIAPRPYDGGADQEIEKLAATENESKGDEMRILRIDPGTGEPERNKPFSGAHNDNVNVINRNLGPAKPTAATV